MSPCAGQSSTDNSLCFTENSSAEIPSRASAQTLRFRHHAYGHPPPASPRPTAPWIPGRAAGPRAPGYSVWWGEGGTGPRDVRLPETARQRRPPSEFVKGGAGGDSVRQSPSRAWRGGPRATWEPQIRLGAVGTTRLLRPESPSRLSKALGTRAQTDLRQL